MSLQQNACQQNINILKRGLRNLRAAMLPAEAHTRAGAPVTGLLTAWRKRLGRWQDDLAQLEEDMTKQQEWDNLLDKWADLGTRAAQHDTWMEPCYEEDAKRATCPSDLLLIHRRQWETTDHFQILYGQGMFKDVIGAMWNGQVPDWEAEHEARLGLLDAFWDAWEHEVGAHELAKKAMGTA